jgi:hypothetical protein
MHDNLAAQLIATARNGIGKSRTRTIRQAVTLQG